MANIKFNIIVIFPFESYCNQLQRTNCILPYKGSIKNMYMDSLDFDLLKDADVVIQYDAQNIEPLIEFYKTFDGIKIYWQGDPFLNNEKVTTIDWDFVWSASKNNVQKNLFVNKDVLFIENSYYESLNIPVTLANIAKQTQNDRVLMPSITKDWRGWDVLQKLNFKVDQYGKSCNEPNKDKDIICYGYIDRDKLLREIAPNYIVFYEYVCSNKEGWDDLSGIRNFTLYEMIDVGLIPIVNKSWLLQQPILKNLLCYYLDENNELFKNFEIEKKPIIEILNYNKLLCWSHYNYQKILHENRKAIYTKEFNKLVLDNRTKRRLKNGKQD